MKLELRKNRNGESDLSMFNKENFVGTIVGSVLLALGLIFFGVGIFISVFFHNFQANAVEITGVISDIEVETRTVHRDGRNRKEKTYYTYVDYTYEGRAYDHVSYGFYTTGMEVGDEVQILLNPDDPSKIMAPGMNIIGYIFGGIGFVFAIAGAIIVSIVVAAKKKKERLLQNGWIVQAIITNITGTGNAFSRRQRPIVVYANYVEPSSGAEYRFVSEGLYNVTNDVRARLNVGYPVNVYVEPGNFRNYYVDLGVC